ncbi:Gustatory receptor 119f [Halyomorpha halys]|nr:Gustatory receptor 119f [Halyomorpha halys]
MVTVAPCQPTTGMVDLVLKDVFKFSRFIGTFPIDYEYSGISKTNLAKGIILYIPAVVIGISLLHRMSSREEIFLSEKLLYVVETIPPIMFYWIHLVWLIRNKSVLKELYDELLDIEYQLRKSGVCWNYESNWYTNYLGVTSMLVTSISWDIFVENFVYLKNTEYIAFYIIHTVLITIINQYMAMVKLSLTILRDIRTIEDSKIVVKLTDEVLALCQKIITVYEPHIFLYVVVIYLVLLFTAYCMIIGIETLNAIGVIWLMSFMCPLVQIVMTVGKFYKEVKKTNKMLYRRLLYNLDDETLQFHLVAKRDIVFTAGGFFILENTLICTMITTGINYLVFFLQYM